MSVSGAAGDEAGGALAGMAGGSQPDAGEACPAEFAAVEAGWRPAAVEVSEVVGPGPALRLAGLFDGEAPVDELPPLWHWLYLLDAPAQAELGADGHPRDGLFLPPLPDRRRMFGGGRVEFRAPIRFGDRVVRRSEVVGVRTRRGGSGWLLLVTVRHTYAVGGEVHTVEEQDIVYKQPQPATPVPRSAPAAPHGSWSFDLVPTETLLFRFSALTYNAHRIHYDRDYARAVEGYPDLVVHGPLLALALLELPRRFAPGRRVQSFTYRLRSPAFAPDVIRIAGGPDGDLAAGAACLGTFA